MEGLLLIIDWGFLVVGRFKDFQSCCTASAPYGMLQGDDPTLYSVVCEETFLLISISQVGYMISGSMFQCIGSYASSLFIIH